MFSEVMISQAFRDDPALSAEIIQNVTARSSFSVDLHGFRHDRLSRRPPDTSGFDMLGELVNVDSDGADLARDEAVLVKHVRD